MVLGINSLSRGTNEDARFLITKGTDGSVLFRRWHPTEADVGSIEGEDSVLPPQVDVLELPAHTHGLELNNLSTGTNEDARLLITVGDNSDSRRVLFRRNGENNDPDVGSIESMDSSLPPLIEEINWEASTNRLRFLAFNESEGFDGYPSNSTHSVFFAWLDANGVVQTWSHALDNVNGRGHTWLRLIVDSAHALNAYLDGIAAGAKLLIVFAQTGSVSAVQLPTYDKSFDLDTLVDGRFFADYRTANLNDKSMFMGLLDGSGETAVYELPLAESAIETDAGAYNLVWGEKCLEWGDSVLKWGVPSGA